ncbi:MAG: enoyl-CoA hydratase/isomerase family protein [Bacteroidetes bacterium]|nr:enoyl-CoA hydratase/isomerase family protein [Bacteroidota bacterium]
MSSLLLTQQDGRVATLILNRPEKRNALSAELVSEMTAAMVQLNANDEVKVIVLRSADKPFCAGADLSYLAKLRDFSLAENEADSQALRRLFDLIYLSPKIVISQVEGPALAGGCGLATLADLCFATPESTFGYTEVKIGFIPALVMVYLREKIGGGVLRDLMLTGRVITAEEAFNLGLVQRLVSTDNITSIVNQTAQELCESTSQQAVASIKEMLKTIPSMTRDEALNYAAKQNAVARGSEDCRKGIDAFLQKQPLKW